MPFVGHIKASARFALDLRAILRDPIGLNEARTRILDGTGGRACVFLSTMAAAVYAHPESPYHRLLKHAGVELGDLRALVEKHGLEDTLARLYDAGVYLTADEFKARRPIRRGSLEIEVTESDFDNPLADSHFEGRTSGSSGNPTRVFIGFDLMTYEAAYYACLFEAHGLAGRSLAFWHAALQTALKTTFKHAKSGRRAERWWTPAPLAWNVDALKQQYVLAVMLLFSRVYGRALPRPRYMPRDRVVQVARWLADNARDGEPAVLETNHSQAIRVCLAARENGLDISGTVFHATGEPFTPAKAEVIDSVGARLMDRYANVEVGVMGLACANPASFDDSHLVTDKLAVIQRGQILAGYETAVGALALTTLAPCTPKLWLNVENGDYATLTERKCGCLLGELGLRWHLSGVRAINKLTSEGVTFQSYELIDLVERVLPSRFGGSPIDYQLFEEDTGGLPRVSLVIRPSVGHVDEEEVLATVYSALGKAPGRALMTKEWRQGGTLRIVRRDPYETDSAKILPLHVRPTSWEGRRTDDV